MSYLERLLLRDDKNLMEHQYVVDMIKVAMEDTCSEVNIPETTSSLKIKAYPTFIYTCKRKSKLRYFASLSSRQASSNPCTWWSSEECLIEKIREVEDLDRGFYGGPIGWLDYQGNGEFAVAIRSGLIQGDEVSDFCWLRSSRRF